MSKVIWEYFSLYITNSEYVNTFQFLTLNYRLYSANYWYDNCEANKHFFGFLKPREYFPKLIDFNHPNSGLWNDNLLLMLQDNRALAETIYGDQQALVNIYDENGNILQTTTFVDAMENTLLPIVNYKTLNKPAPYKIPEKENKSSHDLNLIQIDLDGTYLNLTKNKTSLDKYINLLKAVQEKSVVVFNTQRAFFDTFDYMLYFLLKYHEGFYVCCDNGTSLYHFGFYQEHIIWNKIRSHAHNKMFLRAVHNNVDHYNVVFDDKQYFTTPGIEDGNYVINPHWTISYYSNFKCNKTDLVESLMDEYYAGRIANIINVDDNNQSTMFNIKLTKSTPKIFNYTLKQEKNHLEDDPRVIYLKECEDWIKYIEYDL